MLYMLYICYMLYIYNVIYIDVNNELNEGPEAITDDGLLLARKESLAISGVRSRHVCKHGRAEQS